MVGSMLGDEMMTMLVTSLALVAVLVPLVQGLRTILAGWSATRRVSPEEFRAGKADSSQAGAAEPLALLMIRILQKSLREGEREGQSSDFVFDADAVFFFETNGPGSHGRNLMISSEPVAQEP